jgi:hypothetical protein
VLTRVLTPAPQITAINALTNGQVQLNGAGIAGLLTFCTRTQT